MASRAKQKLREACVGVLRKTEEGEQEESKWGKGSYDEDARFLDCRVLNCVYRLCLSFDSVSW